MKDLIITSGLILSSAIMDSQGFLHAANIWKGRNVNTPELFLSAAGFAGGIAAYWLSIKYLNRIGVISPEIQTSIWMVTTLVGIALVNREFFSWQSIDKAVALGVLAGIGWLATRVGS